MVRKRQAKLIRRFLRKSDDDVINMRFWHVYIFKILVHCNCLIKIWFLRKNPCASFINSINCAPYAEKIFSARKQKAGDEMKRIIAIALGTLVACHLQADTITQTNQFSGTPSYIRALTFNEFNDNGGLYVLDSVSVYVSLTTLEGGELYLDNDSETIASGTVYLGVNGTLSSSDVSLNGVGTSVSTVTSSNMTLQANDGDDVSTYQAGGADWGTMNPLLTSDSNGGNVNSAVLGDYIGADTYDLDFSASQYVDFSALSGVSYSGNPTSTEGYVAVEYNYHVIPEPATASLMVIISGIGFMIRRRFIA